MATRYVDTDRWKKKWFRKMPAGRKLVYMYIFENCDLAGFYEIDEAVMVLQIGLTASQIQGAIKDLASTLEGPCDDSELFWLVDYIKDQRNYPLNPGNRAHASIIRLLESNEHHYEGPTKDLIRGYVLYCTVSSISKSSIKTKKSSVFVPPSTEEAKEAFPDMDADEFIDFYQSKGWMIGKSKMKDWKAAGRRWVKSNTGDEGPRVEILRDKHGQIIDGEEA